MIEGIVLNEQNIPTYSRDWNQREQLTAISLQLNQILDQINKFGMMKGADVKFREFVRPGTE